MLDLRVETGTVPGAGVAAPLWVIGNELGLLNVPVAVSVLSIAPGERYDVVVDFSGRAGQSFVMTNSANAPYPDGDLVVPGVTDQVMRFRVNRPLNPARALTSLASTCARSAGRCRWPTRPAPDAPGASCWSRAQTRWAGSRR